MAARILSCNHVQPSFAQPRLPLGTLWVTMVHNPLCGLSSTLSFKPAVSLYRRITARFKQRRPDTLPPRNVEPQSGYWKAVGVDSGRQLSIFPTQPPPTPNEIIEKWAHYIEHAKDWRYAPPPNQPDDPVLALYRIYENIMLEENIGMRNEIEYFWRRKTWKVAEIPDPQDADPARYAMLAGITELLVIAFNNLIGIGAVRDGKALHNNEEFEEMRRAPKNYETAPAWAAKVPPLESLLKIPDGDGVILDSMDHELACAEFKVKNILLCSPHILFI